MKNIFLFLTLALLLISCKGTKNKKVKTYLSNMHLISKVKFINENTYTARDSSGHTLTDILITRKFWRIDKNGISIEHHIFRVDCATDTAYRWKYDTVERLLGDGFYFSTPLLTDLSNDYIYDKKGNQIERDQYLIIEGTYHHTIEKRNMTEFDKIDEKGNRVEEDCYWGIKDSLNYRSYMKYNTLGQQTEKAKFDNKGAPLVKLVSTYDDDGNKTNLQFLIYKNDSLVRRENEKFDTAGDVIEFCTFGKDGKLIGKTTTQYDNKGNPLDGKIIQGSVNFAFHNRYENFDKEGNWLKRTYFENGNPTTITERNISYYP